MSFMDSILRTLFLNCLHFLGHKCFQVHFRDSHVGSSWIKAVDYCQERTGFLADIASINNDFEQSKFPSFKKKRLEIQHILVVNS